MLLFENTQVDEEQMTKILHLIDSGKKQGAKLVAGGNRHGDKGYFVQPTVFADVQDDMTIAKEEVRNITFEVNACRFSLVFHETILWSWFISVKYMHK